MLLLFRLMSRVIHPLFARFTVALLLVVAHASHVRADSPPEWLYLVFTDPTAPRHAPTTTWMHPGSPSVCARRIEESFAPAAAGTQASFMFEITRVTAHGYEVTFRRVDPETDEPLALDSRVIFFDRKGDQSFPLSEKITVLGHYEAAAPSDI